MSRASKVNLSVVPVALLVSCVALVLCQSLMAQEGSGFKPLGNSAYSNGRLPQQTPGVSKFDPSKATRPSTNFGQPTRTSQSTGQSGSGRRSVFDDQDIGNPSESASRQRSTVEYVDEMELPAKETGVLMEVNIKEGDTVPAGFMIAKIDDTILKHQLVQALVQKKNAESIATDETSIEAAEKQIQLNGQRYQTTKSLFRKGARSFEEKETARYEYEVAQLQKRAAKMRQLEARGDADLANARANEVEERIQRHSVTTAFDGVIVDRLKHQGEWVTAGEPIVKIARMDKLYVTGLISNLQYNPSDIMGKDVVVTVELARKETMEFRGKITMIGSKDVSGSGNEFQVKAEIDNKMLQGQWVLRKNSRVSMKIME